MTDNILPVLPIKNLVNKVGEPTTPQKMETGTKIQYQTCVFYSVHVLYESQLHMLTQSR